MSTPSASRSRLRGRVAIGALAARPEGATVQLAGRVVDVSAQAITLEDASGTVRVECADVEGPSPGTLCALTGTWRDGRVHAAELEVLGGGERVFRASSDYRRLHAGGPVGRLRDRARLLDTVRDFFRARDYLEVDTPQLVPSPGLDLHLHAFEVVHAGSPRFLITSPEYQMKRLLSAGAERIYQVAKCFRQDELGALHETEFSMLEWYRAYSDMQAMMEETEALVKSIAYAARPGQSALAQVPLDGSFERLTVREAFTRYAGACADTLADDEERFYRVLALQVEPELGHDRPTFLTHYPARMASLARLCPDDPSVAERFELYVAGVELCNGFGELTDPDEQAERLKGDQRARAEARLPVYPVDDRFMDALRDGLPPSAGNALGLDRLFALALGLDTIQPVVAFPGDVL